MNTICVCNWLDEVLFDGIHCICIPKANRNNIVWVFKCQSAVLFVSGSGRQQATCFSCFILRCGTWNNTLPLLSPSPSNQTLPYPFSPLLSPLSFIQSKFTPYPFLSSYSPPPFLPLSLSSSTGCLRLFQPLALLSSIWQPQNGNKRESGRWRERDKTVKSQVKSYFQPRCFPYFAVLSFA